MLTKNGEQLLKKFINNEFEPLNDSTPYIPEGEIYRKSPLKYDDKTEISLSELLNNGYVKRLAQSLYYPTTEGKTYFDLKKVTFKNKITWNIMVPAILGFIGGSLPTLFTWLTSLIKWLSQVRK